jgi:hypothetical protein
VGSNPAIYWMDVSYYIFNEKGNKGSQMGDIKKYLKKINEKEILLTSPSQWCSLRSQVFLN